MIRFQLYPKLCLLISLLVISTFLVDCAFQSQHSVDATSSSVPASTAIDSSTTVPNLAAVDDEAFLDEVAYRSFLFFWQETNPQTGLTKDRANNFVKDNYTVSSTAASGFGLTALCIGKERPTGPFRRLP